MLRGGGTWPIHGLVKLSRWISGRQIGGDPRDGSARFTGLAGVTNGEKSRVTSFCSRPAIRPIDHSANLEINGPRISSSSCINQSLLDRFYGSRKKNCRRFDCVDCTGRPHGWIEIRPVSKSPFYFFFSCFIYLNSLVCKEGCRRTA